MTQPEVPVSAARQMTRSASEKLASGSVVEVALRQSDEEGGFSLIRAWFKPNYPLVRHSHDADCLYYVLSGSAIMGSQTLRTGDSFFVPAGAPYGYTAGADGVEILEIRRGVDQFNILVLDESPARREAVSEAIRVNGELWSSWNDSPTRAANRDAGGR